MENGNVRMGESSRSIHSIPRDPRLAIAATIPLRSRGVPQWRLRNVNNEKIAIKRASRYESLVADRTRDRPANCGG